MARYAETERKYEAPSGMKLPDADRLFDLAVGSSDESELDATYLDTDDLRSRGYQRPPREQFRHVPDHAATLSAD